MMTAMKHSRMHQELALRGEVGFAGFVNQLGDFAHGRMHRHVAQPDENDQAENKPEGADDQAAHQQGAAVDAAEKGSGVEIGEFQIGFASPVFLRHERAAERREDEESEKDAQNRRGPRDTVSAL